MGASHRQFRRVRSTAFGLVSSLAMLLLPTSATAESGFETLGPFGPKIFRCPGPDCPGINPDNPEYCLGVVCNPGDVHIPKGNDDHVIFPDGDERLKDIFKRPMADCAHQDEDPLCRDHAIY